MATESINREIIRRETECWKVWNLIREGKVVEQGDYNIHSKDGDGINLLMHECFNLAIKDDIRRESNFNVIRRCVAEGVDINGEVCSESRWVGYTALEFACIDYNGGYEKSLDRIKLLISLGAKVSSDMKKKYPFLELLN